MSCPVCRGETDPRKRMLESLCAAHLAEVEPLDEETIRRAIDEGLRARNAAIAAAPTMRGYYRG